MAESSPESRANSISFRQLRLFESVGRLQSFRGASEECNLSQPAVTQALAKLEHLVGVALLERRASGSYLNEYGTILYRRVGSFVRQIERAILELGVQGGSPAAQVIAKRLSRSKIRSLIATIECATLHEAAETLGLSQVSLQRTAHDLERSLQKQIYYRTSDGMMVTPVGVEFGRVMKLALQEIEWGIAEIEAALGSFNSKIVIGAMPFGGSVLLASVLDDFVAAYPQADVMIMNENSSEMLRSLRCGNVDFALGLLKGQAPDLVSHPLAETPYVIAARRGHKLLSKGKITLDDLTSYDWVIGTPQSSRRICSDALFAGRHAPHAPIVTSSLPVIRHLLARSDRLTIMTTYELFHEAGTLVQIPFAPLTPVPAIGITMRANWHPTRLHTDFINLIQKRVTEFAEMLSPMKLAS